jgi:hypothetical protein
VHKTTTDSRSEAKLDDHKRKQSNNKPPAAQQRSPLLPRQPCPAHRDPSRRGLHGSGIGAWMAEGFPKSCPSRPSKFEKHCQSTAEM